MKEEKDIPVVMHVYPLGNGSTFVKTYEKIEEAIKALRLMDYYQIYFYTIKEIK